jgi:Icc-related predicted phosphoesterase
MNAHSAGTSENEILTQKMCLLFILFAMSFCARSPSAVEKIMEDGTEVVINPYNLDPKEQLFSLEEEFVIDLEEERLASLGLTEIWGFDVDSEGSIYLYKPPWSKGDRILKFDQNGDI